MPRILHDVQHTVKDHVAHSAFAAPVSPLHNLHMQLANLRNLRSLSQRALAEMVGVDASTIQRAEAMADSAMLKTYKSCAEALGVTLNDLFSDKQTLVERELLAAFRKIPQWRHDEVVRLLEIAAIQPPKEDQ